LGRKDGLGWRGWFVDRGCRLSGEWVYVSFVDGPVFRTDLLTLLLTPPGTDLSHKQSITMGTLSTTGHSAFTILSRTQPRYLYPVTGPTTCSTCELLAKGVSKDRKVCVKHMHLVVPEDRRYMVDERLADTIPGLGKVVRMGRWCKGVLGGKGVIRA
jgi:hypothetical protein